ncbi:MAG: LPS export ABC transporter permease LptF [Rhodobiaceae bacterium]|nr:LPS export ABC transporter permease LptF [Rhodobiaceae bacterium]MCC0056500.1 LPS export ABC transporter permease LptF [Rhodobiaceae bacterium]
MNTISRYIFKQAFLAFCLVMGTLIGILWLTQALTRMTLVVDQGQAALLFLKITLYALPTLVAVVAPIALFASCVHTLNRLNADSELVVVNAAGASRWTTIAPFIALGLIVTALTAWLGIFLMPQSAYGLRAILADIRADVLTNIIEPGDFTTVDSGMTFHIRERGRDGSLLGVLVSDDRNAKERLTYIAEKGTIARDGDSAYLVLENGSLQRRSTGDDAQNNFVAFERYSIDLSSLESRATNPGSVHPRERPTSDLFHPDPTDGYYKAIPGRFRAELHRRFAAAFYPLPSVLIALAFVGFARTTRQNRVSAVIMAIGAMAGVRVLGFIVDKLTVKYAAAAPFNYAIPIAAMAIAGAFALGYGRTAVPFLMRHGGARLAEALLPVWERIAARFDTLSERFSRVRGRPA